ncbi:GCrich sequence DNA-binding factor-like protein [Acanthamoeba castellanii str. Neff]|uniref:GCrich sequence DNA-binding factor-like protein n=1 Tax=Acanthamoeba castellanii (strain ATCC 30010 / Neff) TaxID=1257118 RepID=L8GDZ3_ACACF|nr:GCrich sequence DNA-binding factor-like protein [Acanthamoeba castellanii str. Neff]ELR11247.1 GCrich sequence DNA-binding factor-like protein [Acanthamoeba castellanii str. Neff]
MHKIRPARGPKKLRKKGPAAQPKPAAATRRPAAKLSFAEEGEEEAVAFNKPRAGRKLLRGKGSAKPEEAAGTMAPPKKPVPVAVLQRSAAGEYTPEKLAELRKNSKTIYFSSTVRPSAPPEDWPTGEAAPEVITVADDDDLPPDEPAPYDDIVGGGEEEIPSRAAVVQARQRRERIRDLGGFIPLEETSFAKELDSDEVNSRLVRDEEEDPEPDIFDDEKGGRIAFGDPRERERRYKSTLHEQIKKAEEEDSDDEEIRRWELEQIKKGVRGGKELRKSTLERMKAQPGGPRGSQAQQQRSVSVSEHASGVLSSSRVQLPTVEDVQKTLKQALARLEQSCSNEEKELREVKSSIATAESNTEALRKSLKTASEDFDYYQHLRDYILDLLDCLKEKAEEIESYSEKGEALTVGRYAKRREAHYLDVQDRIEEIERTRGDLAVKDEPDVAAAKAQRLEKRLARREARRQRLGMRTPRVEDEEGWSSEDDGDETERERAEHAAATSEVLDKASGVFEDVVDDFASLSVIKQRFEEWRSQHSAGYYKCFAGVSLVDICVPYVKLQTLTWDPLAPGSRTFEDLAWYSTLSTYGLAPTAQAGEGKKKQGAAAEAEEADLVPSLVRRVILPKARAFIVQGWDPRLRQQTRRVQTLVGDLLVYLPAQADLKTLLQAVMLGLQAAVDRVRLPTAYLGLSESATQLAMSQFWNAVKLMGNIASWHEQLSNRALRGLTLDKLLNGQIVPFLRQMKFSATESGITRFVEVNEKVLEAVPSHWLVPEREEGLVTPEARVYHGWATQQWRAFKRDGPRELPGELRQRLAHIFARLNDLETPRQVMDQ